ncbi:MAG: DUF2069 domain-containing protein [Pseudomonadota bacterium]
MRTLETTRWLWLALIAIQLIWFGWLYPSEWFGRWIPLVLFTVPLLIPAWGIWNKNPRAVVLGGTLLLLHFSIAITEAWSNAEVRWIACIELALIGWFYSAMPGIGYRLEKSSTSSSTTD